MALADVILALLTAAIFILCGHLFLKLRTLLRNRRRVDAAFFHPFADKHGGGEKVLFSIIQSMLRINPHFKKQGSIAHQNDNFSVAIFVSCDTSPQQLLAEVHKYFNINLLSALESGNLHFISLSCKQLVEPANYPFATLIFQAMAGIVVAFEMMLRCNFQQYFDACGNIFTAGPIKFFCNPFIGAYIHYPYMCEELITRYHSTPKPFPVSLIKPLKVKYYKFLLRIYHRMLREADLIIANSTWTADRIKIAFGNESFKSNFCKSKFDKLPATIIHYPPYNEVIVNRCRMNNFSKENCLNSAAAQPDARISGMDVLKRKNWVVSVAQFRPEKNQMMQLACIEKLVAMYRSQVKSSNGEDDGKLSMPADFKFIMCGSCKSIYEVRLVHRIREEIRSRGLEEFVEMRTNTDLNDLIDILLQSKVAIHTMTDEHFGISVLEFLCAGLIVIAHDSGGPKEDILRPLSDVEIEEKYELNKKCVNHVEQSIHGTVTDSIETLNNNSRRVGFLATSEDEFAKYIFNAIEGYDNDPCFAEVWSNVDFAVKTRFYTNSGFGDKFCEFARHFE